MKARLRELWSHMLHEGTTPAQVGWAIFCGAIVGCSPFVGLHLVLAVALAFLFGLNKLIVYGAANISIAPLAPFIGYAAIQIGARVLHGHFYSLSLTVLRHSSARELWAQFFYPWLFGGLLLGVAIGAVAGVISYVILRKRRPADVWAPLLQECAARYRVSQPRFRWYAHFKYRMDPVYRVVAAKIGTGTLTVDLGCGLGMLSLLLGIMGKRQSFGIEWDAEKAHAGRIACAGIVGVKIVEGDVRTFELPSCEVVTLIDVLHYYEAVEQRAIIERCHAALAEDGVLLIREGDKAKRGGAIWTRIAEKWATRGGWNRGPQVKFRDVESLTQDLAAAGFTVTTEPVAGPMHPGNVLIVAQKTQLRTQSPSV